MMPSGFTECFRISKLPGSHDCMKPEASQPGAVNGGIAVRFQLEHLWPAITNPEC